VMFAAWRHLDWTRRDSDIDAVREKAEIAKLPAAEQAAWRALWTDVETLPDPKTVIPSASGVAPKTR
jgi:hypothetical protein